MFSERLTKATLACPSVLSADILTTRFSCPSVEGVDNDHIGFAAVHCIQHFLERGSLGDPVGVGAYARILIDTHQLTAPGTVVVDGPLCAAKLWPSTCSVELTRT